MKHSHIIHHYWTSPCGIDEDDGKRQILSLHALLEFQAGHAGHADV